MTRTLRSTFAAALAASSALAVAACGDDDSSGAEATCQRFCEWDETCGPTDSPAPRETQPLWASPAPIDDGSPGRVSGGCVDECVASYRASACLRSTLSTCTTCLEDNGCDPEPCLDACEGLDGDGCSSGEPRTPLDPPVSDDG